jgi:hypothetical protein
MISIGLNLILGVLLFCAMIMGARLERRLRTLRQGQLDFAKAVSELDQAAARTESGLASLRASSETARTELASRIDQARLACQRLEQLTADAEKAFNQPLPLSQALAQAAKASPSPASPARHDFAHSALAHSALAQSAHVPSAFARPEAILSRPVAAPVQMRPAPPSRSRALVDDDLFDVGSALERRPSLAAMMGGRR